VPLYTLATVLGRPESSRPRRIRVMAREDKFDLINLDGPLSVEAILKTLQQRFMEGHCYTWIGPVLLCINPFEAPGPAVHAVLKHLCEQVLQEMANDQLPRALIFNGVCGSGKSFTADRLLLEMFQNTKRTDWLQDIRKYWQVSTVVLRALGTASTEQNKDSSRIGRVVDFTVAEMKIIKIKMNCFFLDQTRLVSPSAREQNYHIFYQMLAGLSPEEKTKYQLNYHDVRTLHYLSQGMEPAETVPQLQSRFEAWKSSLAQLGIPLTDVLKVLSAVMLLGNTLFYEAKNQELQLQGMEELQSVATLLGVQPQSLQRGLTLRTYRSSRGPTVQSPCSAAAANGARDALAKALYIRTVVAVMRRINTLLRGVSQKTHVGGDNGDHTYSSEPAMLHVVDMFGFENSEVNSLEQLCVNWTAEQLQHHYIQSLFLSTISRCTEEGVGPMFETAPYDCSPCLELIGGQDSGLLELLNEETLSPRVSSEDIRVRMRQKFKSNDRFIPPAGSSSTFAIRHYCGTVIYDTYSLLNANADTLADDIIATFDGKVCKFGFVAHLFSVELSRDLLPDGTARGQMCRITPAYLQQASNPDNTVATTYVQDYQSNVQESLSGLLQAQPHHVLCLSSNDKQTSGHFDKEVIGQQIQSMAIFETVDFMQCAYTSSQLCEEFIERYGVLVSGVGSPHSTAREMTEEMMGALVGGALSDSDLADDCYVLGTSLIFMTEELYQAIEGLRRHRLHTAAVRIQAIIRMFLCRRQWPHLKFSLRQAKLQGQAHTQLM
jgi:dachs protein